MTKNDNNNNKERNNKKVSFQVLWNSYTKITFTFLTNFYMRNWPLRETLDITLSDKQPVKTDLKAETNKIILEM